MCNWIVLNFGGRGLLRDRFEIVNSSPEPARVPDHCWKCLNEEHRCVISIRKRVCLKAFAFFGRQLLASSLSQGGTKPFGQFTRGTAAVSRSSGT